jgi:hypothetical protein
VPIRRLRLPRPPKGTPRWALKDSTTSIEWKLPFFRSLFSYTITLLKNAHKGCGRCLAAIGGGDFGRNEKQDAAECVARPYLGLTL